ncbi:GntR family transcriptional regulator [Ottowia thiooxydans]|uniref:GntR family transcriptional regulator n=1 Tax=Ottowia thiooxydans TaxID=219182 RepID=UPI00041152B8|nr:GntR family transcriptional regulator [Ottowia thiooxydans]
MPISKHNTQAHAAYQQIKQRILAGSLTGQDRLREVEVAELLGIGRTPVRESLKRLEEEGLLTHEPRRGLVVTSLGQQAVAELYAMREVLEGAAAGFAARHATSAEIANMEAILDEYGPTCDPVALNLEFHEAIYRAAHNRHLIRSLQSITDTTYLLGRSTLASRERADIAHLEHHDILKAIKAGDADRAGEAARDHIRKALLERLKLLRQRQREAETTEKV